MDSTQLDPKPITAKTIWSADLFRTRIGCGSEQCGVWPSYGKAHNMQLYPLVVFKDAPAETIGAR